ncbi:hypothetical protein BJY52DRAFT_1190868 [Lactarius psammicola]|nr:hypothetical protein BJY52DRAFT_1190868 [Lactarius psammicola]
MSSRHFETVQDSDTEIIEQVTYHQRTKKGIKTTYKQICSDQPPVEKSGQASNTQSRTQRQTKVHNEKQLEPHTARATQLEEDDIGYMDTHEFIDEQEDNLNDISPEGMQTLPTSTMSQWLQYRGRYLDILLEMEGHPPSPSYSVCSTTHADIKCSNCFGANVFCKVCCLSVHKRSPFHQLLLWTGSHYAPTSLYSLGYLLCLGHAGEPCPKTVKGMKASRKCWTRAAASSSLRSVEKEDGSLVDTADHIRQLPTPRVTPQPNGPTTAPAISNTLFDFLDTPMDSSHSHNQYKQLLRASHQWRDLKNRMQTGLGYQAEQETPQDGSMAIFCPTCPQPGINLPDDWKVKYPQDHLIRMFIMDGNFSAEHMRYRTREDDIALSPGMAFLANPDLYKAHLRSGAEMVQPSTCNTYKAIEQANSSRPHLDVTGIGATACHHGFFVPTSVVDFQKGERQINMDYSICKALSYNMEDIPVALVMYDIMCQYRVNFKERVAKSPGLSLSSSMELRTGIGLFHIHGHQDSCLPRYSPSFIPGAKQVDGEIIETLWAPLNNISRSLRGMTLAHRQEVLDAHMNHSNWKKMVRIVPSLLKRWKRLEDGLALSAEAFMALTKRFKKQTKGWLKDDQAAQRSRDLSPEAMDIYDTAKEKAPSCAMIQQELILEESGDSSVHGQISWIACGLKIQEMQLAIRYQLRTYGSQHTSEEAQIIENKCSHLQKLIDMFEHWADSYLLHYRFTEDAPTLPLGDYSEFDHVDSVDGCGASHTTGPSSPTHRHTPCTSNGSGINNVNAKEISILLPSTLGWERCVQHSVQSLVEKEARLRYAQATNSIHSMCLALGFKSALFCDQVRPANTQWTKTQAWDAIHSVDTTVHQHARNYSMARDSFLKIRDAYEGGPELPELWLEDLHVNTAILGATQVGQHNTQLPWIWSFGTTVDQDGTWMDKFNRVHWLCAKAHFQRWMKEQASLHNEAELVPAYFHAKVEQWKVLMSKVAQRSQHGHEAYASQQMYLWEELFRSLEKALSPITSAPLQEFRGTSLYLS